MQNVARIDRQHGGRARQDDREQVERDRAEQEALAPDELQAVDHLTQRMAAHLGGRRQDRLDPADREGREREQDHREDIDRRRMRGIEEAARGRPDNRRRLPGDAAHRDRAGQGGGWDDVRRDRAHRRPRENARHTVQCRKPEQQRQGEPVGPGEPTERGGDHDVDQVRENRDAAAFEPIRRPARDRREQGQRNELEQPQQPELERRLLDRHAIVGARGVIELVADHHDHRDRRHHRGEARRPIIAIVGETERGGCFRRRFRQHRFFAVGREDRCHHLRPTVLFAAVQSPLDMPFVDLRMSSTRHSGTNPFID